MLKANYHTHTELCGHAEGNVHDYVSSAINFGMSEIGMSDHAHTPKYFMSESDYERNCLERMMTDDEFENIYLPAVNEEKKNKKIKVLLGLETEYVEEYHEHFENLRKKLDYLILGMHFFKHNGIVYSSYTDIDADSLEKYTDIAIKAMSTGLYKIFAHPDLFMYDYKSKKGNRVFDETCEKCSIKIIEAAIKYNVYLEINANGIQNTYNFLNEYIPYLYPREEFWQIVSKTKANVLIGADAHTPNALNNEIVKEAIDFANKLNVRYCDFMEI